MKNKVINIIRPRGNAAEKEYLKEFFRFIGCFLSDQAVDTGMLNAWGRSLRPKMEPGGVDIVMNYFGEDPYQVDCEIRGNTRIYCYFSCLPVGRIRFKFRPAVSHPDPAGISLRQRWLQPVPDPVAGRGP